MLTTEQDPRFFRFASRELECEFRPEHGCKVLTNLSLDGEILVVCVYHRFSETNCEMAIASDGKRHWMTRAAVLAAFAYPFNQLGLLRVTGVVETTNRPALRFSNKLGFVAEGLLADWFGPGRDGILLGMTRNNCRWIRHG